MPCLVIFAPPQVGMSLPLPEGGLVYDYRIEDGGLFSTAGPGKKGEEEEEEERAKARQRYAVRSVE